MTVAFELVNMKKEVIIMTASASAKAGMYQTRIDIKEEVREQVTGFLNEILGSTLDLYSQIKQAHWNVKGKDFYQLHLMFDEFATEIIEYVDLVAERVTSLGATANGTVRQAANSSFLQEYPHHAVDGKEHVAALADRYAAYGKVVRDGIDQMSELGDQDTADILTEISRTIDKRLWFIEAHLV
jgi:starvation-inducible DNA-binding protein